MWAAVAMTAANFATSWYQSYIQKAQYDAQHTINEANATAANLINNTNADAANTVRKANNSFQASLASMLNVQRSIGNQSRMHAFSDRYNAVETNQSRILDGMTRGNLATQLKSAETLGAITAQAASRGVAGSSASIMRSVSALAFGHVQTQQADNQKYVTYDALLQKAGLLRAAVDSLDFGQALPRLDYGVNTAPLVQAPINPGDFINPVGQAFISALSNNAGRLANSFEQMGNDKLSGLGQSGGASINDNLASSGDFTGGGTYFNMA